MWVTEMISKEQIKTVWGLAKEDGIEKDNLYCMIDRISKKDSMKEMTKIQANKLIKELIDIKDRNKKGRRVSQKRTDTGGNKATMNLR